MILAVDENAAVAASAREACERRRVAAHAARLFACGVRGDDARDVALEPVVVHSDHCLVQGDPSRVQVVQEFGVVDVLWRGHAELAELRVAEEAAHDTLVEDDGVDVADAPDVERLCQQRLCHPQLALRERRGRCAANGCTGVPAKGAPGCGERGVACDRGQIATGGGLRTGGVALSDATHSPGPRTAQPTRSKETEPPREVRCRR